MNKESVLSNCEKTHLIKALNEHFRLDNRAFDEFREANIYFGKDWGRCIVCLGETKVLANVSCEMQQPKAARPNEGLLYINVELNSMAAHHFETGRLSHLAVYLNRILEKCIKDSKAVDLESLCIKLNEKAWAIRADVTVLNHEGNLLDCASIAVLTALAHFKRPDVTSDGEEIIVNTFAQRDPIPLVLHHYPVTVSYAIFSNGDIVLADPSLLEESVADASFILGANAYRELCTLHLSGNALLSTETILKCTHRGVARASNLIAQIREALEKDKEARQNGKEVDFTELLTLKEPVLERDDFQRAVAKPKKRKQPKEIDDNKQATIINIMPNSSILLPDSNKEPLWEISSDDSDSVEMLVENQQSISAKTINLDSSSEEEEVVTLKGAIQ